MSYNKSALWNGKQPFKVAKALENNPSTAQDLSEQLNPRPADISEIMNIMKNQGLLKSERTGRSVQYQLTEKGREYLQSRKLETIFRGKAQSIVEEKDLEEIIPELYNFTRKLKEYTEALSEDSKEQNNQKEPLVKLKGKDTDELYQKLRELRFHFSDEEWSQMSQKEIARHTDASRPYLVNEIMEKVYEEYGTEFEITERYSGQEEG